MTVRHDRIRGLQASLTNRSLSSVGLLEWDAPGPDPAFISLDPEGALISASTSDALRERGYVPSLIAGLPVSIKDLFDVKGQTTTAGSRVLTGAMPAPRDGTAVARLREAGAVIVGRTNMSEFAFSGLGVNPHFGTPTNPFDATRVAGGSSSGAAASVASGRVAFALGTDTGGSLRIPASFCGLTAFKPTARRIARDGVLPLSRSFDSVGAIARSVDCW